MLIRDGEWIAVDAIARGKLALEVRCPEIVGLGCGRRHHSRMLVGPTPTSLLHEPTASEEIPNRADRGPIETGMPWREVVQELAGPPVRMLATRSAEEFGRRVSNAVRTAVGSSAAIGEATAAQLLE